MRCKEITKRDLPAAAEARAKFERETVVTENLNSS